MICKWQTDCARCGQHVEEGEEIFFSYSPIGEKEKICWLCVQIEGLICDCGSRKKPEHATCYDCKREQETEDGFRCACGNYKKPQYAMCYSCKNKPQEE